MNTNDVLRVLLGEQTISFMDKIAATLQQLQIVRHYPRKIDLYGLQPRIIAMEFSDENMKED